MIICRVCGFSNQPGDEFCGSCGSYLEWSGERVGEEPQPQPPPDGPAGSGPPGG